MKKGLFIVFEGIDGSGTSTQASLLRNRLLSEYGHAITTSEPSEGPLGNMIRQAMKGRVRFSSGKVEFDQQMAYLFAADRHDHLHNEIDGVFKFIRSGTHVISTRYFFSSLAYHCHDEKSFEFVGMLNSKFPNPDMVIYLDNPVELSIVRMANRAHKDAYENFEKLQEVSRNYERIFAEYSGKFLKLDAQRDQTSLHEEIYSKIKELINE
jgi:dTMP kinase